MMIYLVMSHQIFRFLWVVERHYLQNIELLSLIRVVKDGKAEDTCYMVEMITSDGKTQYLDISAFRRLEKEHRKGEFGKDKTT